MARGGCRVFWRVVSWLVMCRVSSEAFRETFDGDVVEWESPRDHFELLSGLDVPQGRSYPRMDDTTGTRQGKFVVATGSNPGPDEEADVGRMLYSACLNPTGPRCTLRFSSWLAESRNGNERLRGFVMPFCHYCGRGGILKETRDLPIVFNSTGVNSTQRWVKREVEVGAVHSLFVLALVADLPDNDSRLALDTVSLQHCQLEPGEEVCRKREFPCPFSSLCLPHHQLCDLHPDCPCGEDEAPASCEHLPSHSQASFRDCEFASGQCYWYNVRSHDPHELPWARATSVTDVENRILPNVSQSGAFVYVSSQGSQAEWRSWTLRSVDFPPLPSPTGLCALRFSYWVSGDAELTVQSWELGGRGARTLWRSDVNSTRRLVWERVVVTVNNDSLPHSNVLQVQVRAGPGYLKSAVALTNLTLSADCFTQGDLKVKLSTCGAEGREGPTPEMCMDWRKEREAPPDITVLTHPPLQGVQQWTVPASAKYSIQAYGARGGRGKEGTGSELNYGAHVQGTFLLQAGEQLLTVVGQTGQDFTQMITGKEGSSYPDMESGGGGGGATFVYRKRPDQEPELLIMAGGGGGLDFLSFDHNNTGALDSGHWRAEVPWGTLTNLTDFRGRGCAQEGHHHHHHHHQMPRPRPLHLPLGGFGAGMGACGAEGGDGGGAEGSSNISNPVKAGKPGAVFVHSDHLAATFRLRSHPEEGRVEVERISWVCPCDFLCRWNHPHLLPPHTEVKAVQPQEEAFVCVCPAGRVLGPDGITCLALSADGVAGATEDPPDAVSVGTAILITLISVLIVLAVCLFYMFTVSGRHERLWCLPFMLRPCGNPRSPSLPLRPSAASSLPSRLVSVNPHYSLPRTRLAEIPRHRVRMGSQLGHGAFGEVYKGYLSGMAGIQREVPVAIKTLPALCSEQTELDFYMEAFILSQFHHGNIVGFLGVCFRRRPRCIVLELLAGGDLHTFLRDSRPPQDGLSAVSVGDLVVLALDICRGCCYLEEQHFIHRDIAARNCLLTSKGPERVAKIADFGMSRDVYRSDYYRKEGRATLPVKWMPPEAFTDGVFTTKTDVWSFGVLLWETLTMGCTPYPALTNTEVMTFIHLGGRLPCPERCPPAIFELMQHCWQQKPDERPTFTVIKQTLTSISQDASSMSRPMLSCTLPSISSSGRGPQLPSPPEPRTSRLPPHTSSLPLLSVADLSCDSSQPLLSPGNSSAVCNADLTVSRSVSPANNGPSNMSYSSLDPLLPPDSADGPGRGRHCSATGVKNRAAQHLNHSPLQRFFSASTHNISLSPLQQLPSTASSDAIRHAPLLRFSSALTQDIPHSPSQQCSSVSNLDIPSSPLSQFPGCTKGIIPHSVYTAGGSRESV